MNEKEASLKSWEIFSERIEKQALIGEKMPFVGKCPYCGKSHVFIYFNESVLGEGYRVMCAYCQSAGPTWIVSKVDDDGEYYSLLKAVGCWNRMTNTSDDKMVPIEYEGKDSSGHSFYSSIHTKKE